MAAWPCPIPMDAGTWTWRHRDIHDDNAAARLDYYVPETKSSDGPVYATRVTAPNDEESFALLYVVYTGSQGDLA